MQKQYPKIHIRMTGEQYARLKENSRAAGTTMNKYLMKQLAHMKPFVFPTDEISTLTQITNEAGKRINEIARAFNGGYGRKEMLDEIVELLRPLHNRMVEIVQKKDDAEAAWAEEIGFVMPVRHKRHAVHKKEKKYLMVRMDDKQYALFLAYRKNSRYSKKLFFCRLIDGVPFDGNDIERLEAYGRYRPVNDIGSNIRQITHSPLAKKLDDGAIPQMEIIMTRLYTMAESILRFKMMHDAIGVMLGRAK